MSIVIDSLWMRDFIFGLWTKKKKKKDYTNVLSLYPELFHFNKEKDIIGNYP